MAEATPLPPLQTGTVEQSEGSQGFVPYPRFKPREGLEVSPGDIEAINVVVEGIEVLDRYAHDRDLLYSETLIAGYGDMLVGDLPPEAQKRVGEIRKETDAILSLNKAINDYTAQRATISGMSVAQLEATGMLEKYAAGASRWFPSEENKTWVPDVDSDGRLVFLKIDLDTSKEEDRISHEDVERLGVEHMRGIIREACAALGIAAPTSEGAGFIEIENAQELEVLQNKLGLVQHDVRTPIQIFGGYMGLMFDPKDGYPAGPSLMQMNSAYEKLRGATDLGKRFLEEKVTAAPIATERVHQAFIEGLSTLANDLGEDIDVVIGAFPQRVRKVYYSADLLLSLVENIRSNFVKSIVSRNELLSEQGLPAETPRLQVRFQASDTNILEIVVEGNGKALPEPIAQAKKFLMGVTDWGKTTVRGTGFGMALHAEFLKLFGGSLIPENIIEKQSGQKTVVGTRLTISVPVLQLKHIRTLLS